MGPVVQSGERAAEDYVMIPNGWVVEVQVQPL